MMIARQLVQSLHVRELARPIGRTIASYKYCVSVARSWAESERKNKDIGT